MTEVLDSETRRHPALRAARRGIVAVVGGTVLLAGVALLVLPGPAVVVIPLGLAILASEFVWARRWLERARERIVGREAPGAAEPPASGAVAALVMAGARGGEDAFLRATGAVHRALIPVADRPLLAHVLDALRASPRIARISASIDTAGAALAEDALDTAGSAPPDAWLESAASPARSVVSALESGLSLPCLVTTADHALLTPEILEHFLGEAADRDADLVVGVVPRAEVERVYPGTRRTGLPFAGEVLCGANLFLFRTAACRDAAAFWVRVEADRKRPVRLARHFGVWASLRFATRTLRLERALTLAGRRMGLRVAAVRIPIAEAAIDVDTPADLDLAEAILRARSS